MTEHSALNALFLVLNTYGHMFSRELWQLVFRGVLLPIFENVRHLNNQQLLPEVCTCVLNLWDDEWLTTTCLNAMDSFIALFSHYFSRLSFLLSDLVALLDNCIVQGVTWDMFMSV